MASKHGMAGSTLSDPAISILFFDCVGKQLGFSRSGRNPMWRSKSRLRNLRSRRNRNLGNLGSLGNHDSRRSHGRNRNLGPAAHRPEPVRYFPCRTDRTSPG